MGAPNSIPGIFDFSQPLAVWEIVLFILLYGLDRMSRQVRDPVLWLVALALFAALRKRPR